VTGVLVWVTLMTLATSERLWIHVLTTSTLTDQLTSLWSHVTITALNDHVTTALCQLITVLLFVDMPVAITTVCQG
jgi:hypothetical protein